MWGIRIALPVIVRSETNEIFSDRTVKYIRKCPVDKKGEKMMKNTEHLTL